MDKNYKIVFETNHFSKNETFKKMVFENGYTYILKSQFCSYKKEKRKDSGIVVMTKNK